MKACGESRKKYFYVHISAVSVIYTRIDWLLANANLTPMWSHSSVAGPHRTGYINISVYATAIYQHKEKIRFPVQCALSDASMDFVHSMLLFSRVSSRT